MQVSGQHAGRPNSVPVTSGAQRWAAEDIFCNRAVKIILLAGGGSPFAFRRPVAPRQSSPRGGATAPNGSNRLSRNAEVEWQHKFRQFLERGTSNGRPSHPTSRFRQFAALLRDRPDGEVGTTIGGGDIPSILDRDGEITILTVR